MRIYFLVLILIIICTHSAKAQSPKALSPEKILKLIPNKIKEFHASADSKSKLIRLGDLRYSMAERNFAASRKRSIKILLFDYKEAPIMYNQATRKWNSFSTVESDSLIRRPVIMNECSGWESYNIYGKKSQILLGVCDHFFLSVEGTNVELEFLKKLIEGFKLETYPK